MSWVKLIKNQVWSGWATENPGLDLTKGEPGIARARLPARPRAENRAIWQNQVPVARTSVTGHARARPLPGL